MTRPRRSVRPTERARTGARATPTPTARLAVIYARVSSREQEREGFSIPAQQELLRKYAADNGFAVVDEFTDIETAKKSGRTAFTKMLAFLRKRREPRPAILVEKTDRLYRNLKDWVSLDEMKVDIHLVKEGIVLSEESRSSEKFIHGIKVLMAKNYVDNLSEEVKKGMHHKAREGNWPSSAPFGYLNERDGGRSFIVPDPERALLLRNLFEQYDTGEHSLDSLAEHAATIGLRGRRGGKLYAATIHTMLRNPLYAGQFYWGGQLYIGKDPKLISWELFDRVQARLDGHPYTRASEHTFAYTGLITCGLCGHAYTAELKKGVYVYYRCAKQCRKGEKYVPERKMTELILRHVARLRMPPHLREYVLNALRSSRRLVADETRTRITAATQRLDRLSRLIDKAYEDKLEGRIDQEFFTQKRLEWEEQRADAAREVERLTKANSASLTTAERVFELANSAYDQLSAREPLQHRDLLKWLFSNFTFAEGTLAATLRKPFDLLTEWPDDPNENGADSDEQNRRRMKWSGREDLNLRPLAPQASALPGCATPRRTRPNAADPLPATRSARSVGRTRRGRDSFARDALL